MPDLKLANQKYKRQLHFRHRIAKMKFPFRIKHENEVWIKSRVFTLVSTKLLHSCSKTKRALLKLTRNGCNFISPDKLSSLHLSLSLSLSATRDDRFAIFILEPHLQFCRLAQWSWKNKMWKRNLFDFKTSIYQIC